MDLFLIPAAFFAGILMFLAPCTLPIVPGYLAFIAGVAPGEKYSGKARKRVFYNALAFVLGFSVLFIALGASAGMVGSLLLPWRDLLNQVAGVIIIIFGLVLLGVRLPLLSQEGRIRMPKFLTIGRPESSFLIGALFALGWSPCIGPILGSILFLASSSSSVLQGAFLLAVFSLGFGVPFLLTALVIERAQQALAGWAGMARILSMIGGIILLAIGILMLSGQMGLLVQWGFTLFEAPYSKLLKYM